jgi:hypothetical protein
MDNVNKATINFSHLGQLFTISSRNFSTPATRFYNIGQMLLAVQNQIKLLK